MFSAISGAAAFIANLYGTFKIIRDLIDLINDKLIERRVADIKETNEELLAKKKALLNAISKAESNEERLHLSSLYYNLRVQ